MEGAANDLNQRAAERAKAKDYKILKRLYGYLAPYPLQIAGALTALCLAAASVLSLGVGLRFLVDGGFGEARPNALDHALQAVLIVITILAVSTFLRSYLVTWLGERVVADIRNDVYARVIRLSPGFFETMRTGEVLSRLTTDTTVVQTVIGASVSQALRNVLLVAGGTALLIYTNPKLSGIALVIVPLVIIPIVVLGRKVRKLSRISQDRLADVSAQAEETVNALKTVQAFAQEKREVGQFRKASFAAFHAAAQRAAVRGLLGAFVITLVFGAVVAVLWIGGHDVVSGRITAGELSSFIFYAVIVASAVGGLADIASDLQRAAGATERLFELLDQTPDIQAPENPEEAGNIGTASLEFDNITFAYPSHPDRNILNNVSLSIAPGETVALVGPSGAGKSSIYQLALRFYDPSTGLVRLNGTSITQFDPETYRRSIALVPQEPVIFSADAWSNIRYGRPDASDEQVLEAAEAAAALDFLQALPHGLNTFLGEKGVRLSGGQRQRIAIARAILCDPQLLLLDEATSALDAESERLVQHALERLMKGRTSIVIAHRLATVLRASRIVVLDQGRIVDSGTHQELTERGGLYARLAKLQFREYPDHAA